MKKLRTLPVKTLPKRIWLSIKSILKLLYFRPAYLLLAAIISVIFYELIFWLMNLGLLNFLITSSYLTLGEKAGILIGSYTNVFSLPLAPLSFTLFIVSILQGVSAAALIYSIRRERQMGKDTFKSMGGTGLTGLLAAFGFGCVACGTSLVTPILTYFFATSSVALASQIGLYSILLALVASLIGAYLAGYKLSSRLSI